MFWVWTVTLWQEQRQVRGRMTAVNGLVCVQSSVFVFFKYVCVCVDTRKISTRKTQRDWWFITTQVWRLRSSSVSSMIPRLQHICWTPQPWLSNLTRNRYHRYSDNWSCNQHRNITLRIFGYSSGICTCKYSSVCLLGVGSVGLPNKTGTNKGQCCLPYQGQSGARHHRPVLLGRSSRAEAGKQAFALWQDFAAQVPKYWMINQGR